MAGEGYFHVPVLPCPGPFTLDGPEGRHAGAVRRMRPGEGLVLSDGQGCWAPATVTAAGRDRVTVQVGPSQAQAPPTVRVVLVQALPKGEHGERAVDLATQAGADVLVPWQAERCIARWSDDRAERGVARWRSVAGEAAKQSRRAWVPEVRDIASTPQVVELIAATAGTLVLHEGGAVGISRATMPTAGDLVVVVGPEGGISPAELHMMTAAGATPVRLGREVLRTSSAGAVALGALGVLARRWS